MHVQEVQTTLQKYKPHLQQKYHVKTIGVFGSYVRGEQTLKSDIDVLVEFDQPIGLDFMNLQMELQSLLGKKVDLVTTTALKPRLRSGILQEVIYA